jgi:TRAP-type uncharacterized transport system fused permease subunit
MKATVILIVLVALSFSSFAQFNQQQQSYVLKIGRYNKMKRAGALMIVAGVAAGVVGVSTMSSGAASNNNGQANSKFLTGFVLTVSSFPLLGMGIPFTIVGASGSKKYQRKLEGLSVHFNMAPQNQGIGISYKF